MRATLLRITLLAALGLFLARGLFSLPENPPNLVSEVTAHMPASGVTHPLTAVLLNFRGYDTLIEIAVLLLAGVAGLAVGGRAERPARIEFVDQPPVLVALARLLLPAIVLTGMYVLWIGSYRPGGAFQAGAILGAGGVLLAMAGVLRSVHAGFGMRLLLGVGTLVFASVAGFAIVGGGRMLGYPVEHAGQLILLIEFAATWSIAATLTVLFLEISAEETPR